MRENTNYLLFSGVRILDIGLEATFPRTAALTEAIYRNKSAVSIEVANRLRKLSGRPQEQFSSVSGRPQSFMSDVERGTRRLDLIQVRDPCTILGVDLKTFVELFERG